MNHNFSPSVGQCLNKKAQSIRQTPTGLGLENKPPTLLKVELPDLKLEPATHSLKGCCSTN